MPGMPRGQFQEELRSLEEQALGGLDLVVGALDPISTAAIEDLMLELVEQYSIVIVTHNMQQAARVSDRTAFFTAEADPETGQRTGLLVEYNPTTKIFTNPADPRTEAYVTGKMG